MENNEQLKVTDKRFYLVGKVSGTKADDFFVEKPIKNNESMRTVKFAVNTSETNKVYVEVFGCTSRDVIFKTGAKDVNNKDITETVAWNNRGIVRSKGYSTIGDILLGLSRGIDEAGKESNIKQYLLPYDACEVLHKSLIENTTVFVKGKKEISTYVAKDGSTRTSVKLRADQISLCADQTSPLPTEDNVDYSTTKTIPNRFEDVIVFKSIEQDKQNKPTDPVSYTVTAINVSKSKKKFQIAEHEYKVYDPNIARIFNFVLKPYNALRAYGKIMNNYVTEAADTSTVDDLGWGIPITSTVKNYQRENVILALEQASLDTTTYTAQAIENAKLASMEYRTNTEVVTTASAVAEEDLW